MLENFTVVGHRGFRSRYPENTLVSFKAAMDWGIKAIEFDVHPTKDHKLVVTHDHTVERCSNGKGFVHDMTFDEIRKLDFGGWKAPEFAGTQIPTFEETLDCILSRDPDYYVLIELKEDDDDCTRQVFDICQKYSLFSHSLILSFHPRQLQLLRGWKSDLFLQGFPYRYLNNPPKKLYGSIFNKICIWTNEATNAEIADFHDLGVTVDICAVDDEQQFNKALTLDCDSITTNNPEVIWPLMKQHNLL